jgi:hypothetical protein
MDYSIRFIGVIMLVTQMTGSPFNNHAFLPLRTSTFFCGSAKKFDPPAHKAYVRINTGQIAISTGWPAADQSPCDPSQGCTLFEIPEASTLTINSKFTPTGVLTEDPSSFCLVPQINHEVNHSAKLIADPVAHSIVDMELPAGDLKAVRMPKNDMMVSLLDVHAPSGSAAANIEIVATPHATGGTTRKLEVKAGSLITIEYTESGHAGVDPGMVNPSGPVAVAKAHFFLFNELLDPATQVCVLAPRVRPCPKLSPKPAAGLDFVCSNSGCCHP